MFRLDKHNINHRFPNFFLRDPLKVEKFFRGPKKRVQALIRRMTIEGNLVVLQYFEYKKPIQI